MNKMTQRGQINVAAVAVAAVVVFTIIAIGMALTSNVYSVTGQTPSFSDLWPVAVAGVAILAIIISVFALLTPR